MEKKKRNLLKNTASIGLIGVTLPVSWSKPMVNSILLPTHATMSKVCSTTQIAGRWEYLIRDEYLFYVDLRADGTGTVEQSGTPLTWTFNGINRVAVKIPIGPVSGAKEVYDGVVSPINPPHCDSIHGDVYFKNVKKHPFLASKF